MRRRSPVRLTVQVVAGAAAVAAAAYGAYAFVSWLKYGHASADANEADELLDRFMPAYDVVERHQIRVGAPPAATLRAAMEQDLLRSGVIRAIFRTREIVLGATPDTRPQPRGLLALTKSLGWGVLAEKPGREIVVGAVTKPWEANVIFHAIPPDKFAAFNEPGFVKIAWTLRADRVTEHTSVFRTETRAIATDNMSRARFRRYWARASPGISVIRWLSLRPLKRDAERRAREPSSTESSAFSSGNRGRAIRTVL
jgi:hypothetical protein